VRLGRDHSLRGIEIRGRRSRSGVDVKVRMGRAGVVTRQGGRSDLDRRSRELLSVTLCRWCRRMRPLARLSAKPSARTCSSVTSTTTNASTSLSLKYSDVVIVYILVLSHWTRVDAHVDRRLRVLSHFLRAPGRRQYFARE